MHTRSTVPPKVYIAAAVIAKLATVAARELSEVEDVEGVSAGPAEWSGEPSALHLRLTVAPGASLSAAHVERHIRETVHRYAGVILPHIEIHLTPGF